MVPDKYLPTIKQILDKADTLGDSPMDADESEEWFKLVVSDNKVSVRDTRLD